MRRRTVIAALILGLAAAVGCGDDFDSSLMTRLAGTS